MDHLSSRRSTASNFWPSSIARLAPPPVLTCETRSAKPSCSMAAALSPPPMMLVRLAVGNGLGDGFGAGVEGRRFEHAHRPVPDDGLGLPDHAGERRRRPAGPMSRPMIAVGNLPPWARSACGSRR